MSTSGQPSSSNTAQRTFCKVCQDSSECEFRKYFNRVQSSNQDWQQEARSDRSRYYVPEQQSEMRRLRRLAQENEILDRARPQRMAMMTAEEREIQNRNFAHVAECRRTRQTLIQDHIGRFPVTGPDVFFKRTPYQLWLNSMESTSVRIGVYKPYAVQNSRYYLRHRPGTYIFKLRYDMGTGLHTFMGAAGCVTIGDLEYMGQVPRHESVYDLRFKAMLGDVMRLFIGELRELHALSDPDQQPEPQGPDPAKIRSAEGYTKVWELWKDLSNRSEGVWPTSNLQFKFKTCPIVLELGWLMNLLPRRRSGNGEHHALEELMVNATGTSLSELSMRWESKERAAALNMLKSGDLDLLIYIPTPDTEDIHNFYSQARFDSDPLNPNFRFRLAELESPPVPTQSNSTPSGNPGP
ncbi:uncharacterized protein B0J16DRAFT_325291 [Fusarium flagelliforme]|uniref:uncharacterized protein n=1 Tax=Fusarium flagelliforme TaxID=2675880 RepID=UPI001E8CEA23|nr:uncharacterized protein B0J16DRAFT_325291 [Fusarium flagelliforme]KAH7173798.1 hypothetical protein B0J16DRAFT_325291 [Fusarium flagelliforme]